MQNIRIGNDFPIEWRIYRLGDPEILNEADVSVRLFDSYMKPVPFEYHIEDNQVSGVFEGRNQKRTGAYTLKLVKNYGRVDMVTIDEVNAFCLVQHSYQEGGSTTDTGLTINHVDLNTELSVATNGIDGDSAYKIAVNNGFDGTQAEWLASLVGADGADGQNAYECAVRLGYEGTEAEWLASLKGKDGKSAYELVKQHNPTYDKTEEEFAKEQIKKVVTSDKIAAMTLDISNPDEDAVLYTPQSKTAAQKLQARVNINAADLDNEIILEDTDIEAMAADPTLLTSAVRVTPQIWTQAEKTQAQNNIGVADESRVVYLEEKMAILDSTGVTVIGDINTLTTDAKDYIVDAINEVDAHTDTNTEHIGDMTDLEVKNADGTNVPDLVTALNILKNSNGMSMVEEPVPDTDMVRTYSIYNGVDEDGDDILVGKINIPLDKVALSGEVITATGTEIIGTAADGTSIRANVGERYLVITLKNDPTKIYIALAALDYTAKQPDATAGETILQVQVAIDATKREISATIGEDTITHTELDKLTEHELDFTGYDHNKDNAAHADFGKPQLTTTAQTLAAAVNELDELQGDATNLPYRDVTDPANPKYPTITENIKKLYDVTQGGVKHEAIYDTYTEWDTNWRIRTFDADEEDGNPVRLFQIKESHSFDELSHNMVTGNIEITSSRTYQNNWFILGKYNATTTRYDWIYIDNPGGLLGKLDNLKTDKKLNLVQAINELWATKSSTIVVDTLPDIADATVLATVSEKDIYILHETVDVLDAAGNKVQATEADGTPKVDLDGVTPIYEQEEYYTPYRLNDDKDKWLCLYHRHEHEIEAIDFDADITW